MPILGHRNGAAATGAKCSAGIHRQPVSTLFNHAEDLGEALLSLTQCVSYPRGYRRHTTLPMLSGNTGQGHGRLPKITQINRMLIT